jgi:hypothetical protein
MDKWDAIVNRIKQGMLAEEPEAALAGGLELLAEFGRTLDRIADALESPTISGEPAPIMPHDL